jgi:hypothetical protein
MDMLIAVPVFLLSAMLQVTAISRIPLIHGTADLSMLILIAWGIHSRSRFAWLWAIVGGIIMSIFSRVTWLAIIIPYAAVIVITRLLHGRFWDSPILAMLIMTISGSFLFEAAALIALLFMDIAFDFNIAFSEIILPSIFLNLLLAFPVYFLLKDLARWIYPQVENE